MKLPALFRKKNAAGRFTGNFRTRVKGTEINLGTSDANEARTRLLEAVRHGRRKFVDELDEAAAATEAIGGADAAAGGAAVSGPGGQVDTRPPPVATSAPPLHPDAVIPPPPAAPVPLQLPPMSPASDAAAEAAATNEAAAETSDGQADAGAAAAAAAGADIPDDVLDGMLEMGALLLVDLQIGMQGAIIRKGLKVEPGKIPPEAPQRSAAAKAWVQQLKIWFPSAVAMPPWAWALLIPATCAVQQITTATPLKKQGEPDAQPPADSGDQPVQAAA